MKVFSEPGVLSRSERFFSTPSATARRLFYYVTRVGHYYYDARYNFLDSCDIAHLESHKNLFLMTKGRFRTAGAIESIATLPIMIPEIILGIAFLTFFSFVGIPYGMPAMIIGHCTFCIPYIFINVRTRLLGIDPSIEEAARDLCADGSRVF